MEEESEVIEETSVPAGADAEITDESIAGTAVGSVEYDLLDVQSDDGCSILDSIVMCNIFGTHSEIPKVVIQKKIIVNVEDDESEKLLPTNCIFEPRIGERDFPVEYELNENLISEPTHVENKEIIEGETYNDNYVETSGENIMQDPITTVTEDVPVVANISLAKMEITKITLQREVNRNDVEILHLHEENKTILGSRSNSDIQLWLDNQSQYSFIMQKSLRPLTTQLSNVGVKTQGYLGRFAYLTDEILSKLCDTTGEILKSGKIFTRRIWSSWYPEHNPLTTIEAWQLIILEVIYRIDPPLKEKRKCEQFVKQELKLQEKQYKMLAELCNTIVEKSYRAKQIIKKLKNRVKHKFETCSALIPPSLRKNNDGIKYQSSIPIRQRKPQYRGVKVIPILKKNDYIFKCGERGLLIKKVLGMEVHFGSLEYSSKQEFFRMCLYEVLSLSHKSEKKLQNALVNLSFESPVGKMYGKKSIMQRYCEEMMTIVKNKAHVFWPTIKVLVNGQIERIETEIKAVIEAADNMSTFFKNQSNRLRLMRKNLHSAQKGTFLKKYKREVISHLKEFHMKISTFPFNISDAALLHQNQNFNDLTCNGENAKQNAVVIIESEISGFCSKDGELQSSGKSCAEEILTVCGTTNGEYEKDADICILVDDLDNLLLNDSVKNPIGHRPSSNAIEIPTGDGSSDFASPRIEVHDIRQCSEYVKRFYFACAAIASNFEKCKQNLENVREALYSKSQVNVRIDRGKHFLNCTALLWIAVRAVKSLQVDEEKYINARYNNNTPVSSKQSKSNSQSVEAHAALKNLKRAIEQEIVTFFNVLSEIDNCMKQLKSGKEKMVKIVRQICEKNILFCSPSGVTNNISNLHFPSDDQFNTNETPPEEKNVTVSVKPDGILVEYLGKDVMYERCKPEIRVRLFHILFQNIIGQFDAQCDGLRETVGCIGSGKRNKSTKMKTHQENGLISRLHTVDRLLTKLYKKKNFMTYNEEQMVLKSYEKVENQIKTFSKSLKTLDKQTMEFLSEVNLLRKPLMALLEIQTDKGNKVQSYYIKNMKLNKNRKASETSLECLPEMFCWFNVTICNDNIFQRNLESLFVSEGLLPTKVKSKKKKANKTHSM